MKKYRKSLVSVAAAVAISSSILGANYLPLTTSTSDNKWVLVGVTGYVGTSGQSAASGEYSVEDLVSNKWEDATEDNLGNEKTDIGTLKAIDHATIKVRLDTSNYTIDQQEPTRTIYVTDATGNTPFFAFTYKAAFEGEKLEYESTLDASNVYYVTLNSDNTYSNPAVGVITPATGGNGITEATLNSLVTDAQSVVDYNLSNNPPLSSDYEPSVYRDQDNNDSIRMFSYIPSTGGWDIHDSRNNDDSNNFNTIEKGK